MLATQEALEKIIAQLKADFEAQQAQHVEELKDLRLQVQYP